MHEHTLFNWLHSCSLIPQMYFSCFCGFQNSKVVYELIYNSLHMCYVCMGSLIRRCVNFTLIVWIRKRTKLFDASGTKYIKKLLGLHVKETQTLFLSVFDKMRNMIEDFPESLLCRNYFNLFGYTYRNCRDAFEMIYL